MSRRQLRGSQKISKSKNKRSENIKILIAAEGVNTEPQYFEKFSALIRAKAVQVVSVKPVGVGRDPLSVVNEAKRLRDLEDRGGDPFDAIWCVVDVDEHASLERACIEARRSRIEMAISSPCFEIWLLWHFDNCTTWIDAATLSKLLRKQGFSGKNMPDGFPYEKYPEAMTRASKCEHVKAQHAPPNPHSSVGELISVLLKAYGHEV
ncbi:RloB family protein [Streptomyces fulvoviolaceus]|uniref:RloB family protein n=1 Tax=Streptomyces fulvoviolaceus TaxID=285535 RepID=UPI000998B6F3|nr:RloB family protein [Streptomyces fulvoviolaceus]MCT9075096.1 RloB family protein [Streptomyces fulvoviolaceus]